MATSSSANIRPRARRSFTVVLTLLLAFSLVLTACNKKAHNAASSNGASAPISAPVSSGSTAVADGSGCPSSNTKSFAKTKFVLHVGLAAGTFHRYLYKPFRAGSFSKGAHGRTLALVKGGATALFDAHELVKAEQDVQANPTLCKVLLAPIKSLASTLSGLKSKIIGGDTSSLPSVNSAVSSLESASSSGGVPITESTDESQG